MVRRRKISFFQFIGFDIKNDSRYSPPLNEISPTRRRFITFYKEDGALVHGRCVLVIDGLRETVDVLKAVLEPRGTAVSRIRSDQIREMALKRTPLQPNVVVFHDDGPSHSSGENEVWENIPHVVIGSKNHEGGGEQTVHPEKQQYLKKPFHYSELVQAIERLLPDSALREACQPSSRAA